MLPFNSVPGMVDVTALLVFADSKADWTTTSPVSRLFVRRLLT